MKKQYSILLALLLLTIGVQAEEVAKKKVYNGYSGGMMLHAGYLFGNDNTLPHNPQGLTYGIGGALRINLWEHLRVGFEGYVSTMPSSMTDHKNTLQEGSYVRNGWGGLLIDSHWRFEKIWPYIGGTIGGGAKRSLFIADGSQEDWQAESISTFNKQGYFMLDPFVGFDYLLTQRVHLTIKVDYMLALDKGKLLTPIGPRFYIGFLFCH